MKRIVSVIAVAGLIGTPAFAADIALKAPPYAPAPVYNWTGWYVGLNAGASFGNVNTNFNGAPINPPAAIGPGFAFSDRTYPDGFMGGGQIGYNFQFSPIWVVGLEADFQGALERDSANLSNPFSTSLLGGLLTTSGTAVTDYTTKIEWFGTARARIGYVWGNGNVMSYLTGGLAYGKVDLDGTNAVSGTGTAAGVPFTFFSNHAFDHNAVNIGWVVGYGTEGVIDFWGARNWTWKIEGLYMDLGHLDTTGVTTGSFLTGGTIVGGQVSTNSHFTDGILRAGINYKFF